MSKQTAKREKAAIWRGAILQAFSLAFMAMIIGLIVNQFRADRLPLIGDRSPESRLAIKMTITLDEARRFCESRSAIFLDARSSADYKEGHIFCARNLPLQDVDKRFESVMGGIAPQDTIIVYCDGEECPLSEELAKELFFRGYENVRVLANGWSRWLEAGFPIAVGQG